MRPVSTLVTGGAGYIGGHIVDALRTRGEAVVVVDDLSTGVRQRATARELVACDLAASDAPGEIAALLRERDVRAVIHLAAKKQVGESVAAPAWYYRQNIGGLANLLLGMEQAGVGTLVFSSSAAVYGDGTGAPAREDDATAPINPYGETKLVGEWLVRDAASAGWLRAVSLRYFNAAGAGSDLLTDRFATNLIPLVFARIAAGEAPRVFGGDYPTPDGTCIRDYVHVADLADAHLAVLDALRAGSEVPSVLNIGTGAGRSVLEVLEAIQNVTGHDTAPIIERRRAGDPASLVADATLVSSALGWTATRTLSDMVASAWSGFQARGAVG